jgi:hypothetical protein
MLRKSHNGIDFYTSNIGELDKEDKKDILISIMNSIRMHLDPLGNFAYRAAIWSVGILLTLCAIWLGVASKVDVDLQLIRSYRFLFVLGLILIGLLSSIYIYTIILAIKGNGNVLVRCEAALKLTEKDCYLKGEKFFMHKSKNWVIPYSIYALLSINIAATILAIVIVLSIK